MVFTGVVRIRGSGHGRRQVLAVAVAGMGGAALAGCGLLDRAPAPQPTPDVLRPLLDETLALVAAYDRATVAQPGLRARLTPLADDHRAHAVELAALIGTRPPSAAGDTTATPTPAAPGPASSSAYGAAVSPAAVLAGLRAAEQAGQRNAVAACMRAPAQRTPLLGSIAACRAAHAEALR